MPGKQHDKLLDIKKRVSMEEHHFLDLLRDNPILKKHMELGIKLQISDIEKSIKWHQARVDAHGATKEMKLTKKTIERSKEMVDLLTRARFMLEHLPNKKEVDVIG